MHTAHVGWKGPEENWGAPRAPGYRGEDMRQALRWPGSWVEEVAPEGKVCWEGPAEVWGGSRWAGLEGEEV